jgi:hypothetical protein
MIKIPPIKNQDKMQVSKDDIIQVFEVNET